MYFVSILIPCHNAAPHLAQAIESALVQTWENKEIILLDDGSTDASYEIANSYPIEVVKAPLNQGQAHTRNALFELSKGAWIQHLDADDYLLPDKISNQLKYQDEAEVLIDNFNVLSEEGAIFPHNHADTVLETIARGGKFQSNCFLFKREVLERIKWQNYPCQDSLMVLDLVRARTKIKLTGAYSSVYRRGWSEQQITNQDLDFRRKFNESVRNQARDLLLIEEFRELDKSYAMPPRTL
jgi:glycosyltransferase involved in cell wall biosynthesis